MSDRYPGRRYGGGASLYLGRGRRRGRGRQYFGPPIGHINRYQPRLPHSPKEQSDRHPQAEASLGHNNFQQVTSTERLQRLVEAKRNLELEIINSKIEQIEMERDSRSRRYGDGEVTRYGAGESYRPFNSERTPRRVRSPPREPRAVRSPPPREPARSPPRETPRDRPRSPPREPRELRERQRSPPREPRDRPRSPPREPRERLRSPPREPRARTPPRRERPRSPPVLEDRYIPSHTPRRRSRSPFRPDRSRDRGREDDRGLAAADTWRRQRSRSPVRRPSPRRSPIRRNSPPPPARRFSPQRRDMRDDRDRRNFSARDPRSLPQSHSFQSDRPNFSRGDGGNPNDIPVNQSKRISQSPHFQDTRSSDQVHDYDGPPRRFVPQGAYQGSGQRQSHVGSHAPNLITSEAHFSSEPLAGELSRQRGLRHDSHLNVRMNNVDTLHRGRSRSADRDRRDVRDRRSPPRRVSPIAGRGGTFRRRSPSIDRRDDRYNPVSRRPSPPRDSAVSSTYQSRDQSRRQSPLPLNGRRADRSNPQSPLSSRHHSRSPQRAPPRDRSPARPATDLPSRSPPRGPAALRGPPPTGPKNDRPRRDLRDDRDTWNFSGRSVPAANETPARTGPGSGPGSGPGFGRQDATSAAGPPSGPRGYGAPRGGYGRGAGRGSNTWIAAEQSRNNSPPPGPTSVTIGTSNTPTPSGPRVATPLSASVSTPIAQAKPFNPPKGPAAEKRQLTVFEKEIATMTPIIPGGKMSVEDEAAMKGVLPELLSHFKAAEEEADRIRKEMEKNEEKTRAMMAEFRKGQRECELLKLRTDLTEAAVAKSSGEGFTGSAF